MTAGGVASGSRRSSIANPSSTGMAMSSREDLGLHRADDVEGDDAVLTQRADLDVRHREARHRVAQSLARQRLVVDDDDAKQGLKQDCGIEAVIRRRACPRTECE